nr:MarR family winged helix-turn-helix transcriptional regulator [uncultured Sellimonas sp.]
MEQELKEERDHHIGRIIHMISHQLKRQGTSHEEITRLTPMQKHILTYIVFESTKQELYQKDIEEEFQIRRSTASGILQLMEKNGFIVRESVEKDARLKRILPTEKAEKLRMQILNNIRESEKKMKSGIPEKEIEICLSVLRRILKNIS